MEHDIFVCVIEAIDSADGVCLHAKSAHYIRLLAVFFFFFSINNFFSAAHVSFQRMGEFHCFHQHSSRPRT